MFFPLYVALCLLSAVTLRLSIAAIAGRVRVDTARSRLTQVAGVYFSESSRRALTFAARLARHADARLHVVHAQDPLLAHAARAAGVDIDAETRAELSAFMQSAPPAGDWSPFQDVADGSPVTVLCDAADRVNADVIVIGAGVNGLVAAGGRR